MLLSECAGIVPLVVRRDAEFRTPGLLADPQPEMLAFVEDRGFLSVLRRSDGVACVLATEELASDLDRVPGLAVADSPRRVFCQLHNHLAGRCGFYWTDFPTEIQPSARIHPTAWVADRNVRIGPGTVVDAHATIHERSLLGANVLVQAGSVIGGVGLQLFQLPEGVVDLVHAGSVVVEDGVQIFAQTVVARALFRQATTLGRESRLGNHVFVSHNVQVGDRSVVAHGAIVNGNVRIGRDCWIGPGATISHCVRIGDGAQVTLGSTVVRDVETGQRVSGNFAVGHRRFLRQLARIG